MKTVSLMLAFLLAPAGAFLPPAYAIPYSYSGNYAAPENQSGFYEEQIEVRAGQKLHRGLKNFFLCWLEVPHGVKLEIHYREQEYLEPTFETFMIGTYKGFMRGLGRMGVGFYEIVTFPYPQRPVIQEMDEWLL